MDSPAFLVIIPFCGFGLLCLWAGLYRAAEAFRASRWPTTEGRVTFVTLDADTRGEDPQYTVRVRYEFGVGGLHYEGSRVAHGYHGSTSEDQSVQLYTRYKGGPSVLVHYDPANPHESCLSCRLQYSTWVMLVGGMVFLGTAGGTTMLVWWRGR